MSLKTILASEGLTKAARGQRIGYITNYDGHYGNTLSIYLNGSTVTIEVTGWGQLGGMDSPYSKSTDPTVDEERVVPADAKVLVRVIKDVMANRRHVYLDNAKPSTFQWNIPYPDKKNLVGLTIMNAQMALDAWEMDREEWEIKYTQPQAPARANPFAHWGPTTKIKEIAGDLTTQGYENAPAWGYVPGAGRIVVAKIKEQRKAKGLQNLFKDTASRTQHIRVDYADAFLFTYNGLEICLAKLNQVGWAVFPYPKT